MARLATFFGLKAPQPTSAPPMLAARIFGRAAKGGASEEPGVFSPMAKRLERDFRERGERLASDWSDMAPSRVVVVV